MNLARKKAPQPPKTMVLGDRKVKVIPDDKVRKSTARVRTEYAAALAYLKNR